MIGVLAARRHGAYSFLTCARTQTFIQRYMETLEQRIQRVAQEDVAITPYDPRWPELFRQEKGHLLSRKQIYWELSACWYQLTESSRFVRVFLTSLDCLPIRDHLRAIFSSVPALAAVARVSSCSCGNAAAHLAFSYL